MERKSCSSAKSYKFDVIKMLRGFFPRMKSGIPVWRKLKMGGNRFSLGETELRISIP
jgi:hypothetical protein